MKIYKVTYRYTLHNQKGYAYFVKKTDLQWWLNKHGNSVNKTILSVEEVDYDDN